MNLSVKGLAIGAFVNLFRLVVAIYTRFTLHWYYLWQWPWRRLVAAQTCGAELVAQGRFSDRVPESLTNQKYLEYERRLEMPPHPFMHYKSMFAAIESAAERFGPDTKFMAYREVVRDEIQYDRDRNTPIISDGKVSRKYYLTDYRWMTYGQVWDQITATAAGIKSRGLQRHESVGIFAETGHRFLISFLGSQLAGAIPVTLYHTLTDEGLLHAINETRVRFMFVGSEQLTRVRKFIEKCPTVESLIYFEGPKPSHLDTDNPAPETFALPNIKLITFTELQQCGIEGRSNVELEKIEPDDIFGVLYTSGTTGIPKGVQMTHRQVRSAVDVFLMVIRNLITTGPENLYVAYLPPAHIMELSLELMMYSGGVKIGYATPATLTESSPGLARGQISDLQLLKPTIMASVPLVLERIQKQIIAKLQARTPVSRDIFDFLISYKAHWMRKGYTTPIINKIVCRKIKEQFGGRLKYMVVGSAPVSPQLQEFIRCALDVILFHGYGMTETCGAAMCTDFYDLSVGRTGAPIANVKVRLIDWVDGGYSIQDQPNPRGEIIVGGPNIASGYLNREDINRGSFFDDYGYRWFVTGDIGEVYPDGTFQIIDRKKGIVKLANGEFVSLGKIETAIKNNQYVDNVCIVADGTFNCLIGLVAPNLEQMRKLSVEHGFDRQLTAMQVLCQYEPIVKQIHRSIINEGIKRYKLKPIELPALIHICPERWGPENGLLTAAMKLKRSQLLKFYHNEIEQMWNMIRADPELSRVRID